MKISQPKITGTTIIRDTSAKADKGRKILMVCALIAVPENVVLGDDQRYIVVGEQNDDGDLLLQVLAESGEPLKSQIGSMRPDQLFTSPIWRY